MNPLQEYPNLFTNGEFKVLTGLENDLICEVHAYDWNSSEFMIYSREDEIDTWHSIDKCTLIARPIEDMTNKEFFSVQEDMSVLDLLQKEEFIKVLSEQTETKDGLGLRWVKCLGDWGMYFGPQSHFDDGTVIDSREI